MMKRADASQLEAAFVAERTRLMHFCERVSGDHDSAEDIVQEVFLEAWRHRHRLYDPAGTTPWLLAIARNVCLRWQRKRARELPRHALRVEHEEFTQSLLEDSLEDEFDLEVELERQELARLLDRAMALLPADTRALLIDHYLYDVSSRELATRLQSSEGAIRVRLHRGKLELRRVLETHLPEEAAQYGLSIPSQDQWQVTRIWCSCCGRHRLQGRFSATHTVLVLRCPGCTEPGTDATHTPVPGRRPVKGYKAALSRIQSSTNTCYGLSRPQGILSCPGCTSPILVHVSEKVELPQTQGPDLHVSLLCKVCGWSAHSSLGGVALALPKSQAFWRAYPQMRTHLAREITIEERPCLLTRFESVTSRAYLEVLMDRASFRVTAVRSSLSV